jgi:DegV family protein with EDD domain
MSSYVITSCSTADMPIEFFKNRNVPYVCFHYMIDGKDYLDDLYQSITPEAFYNQIADGAMPTTSQVNASAYQEFWEPILKEGKDIIHLVLSSGISGSINSARIARDMLLEDYPERKLVVIDSLAAASGFGLLLDSACDLRDAGKSLEEVVDWVESHKLNLHHWFFSSDLTSFVRGGRISKTSGFFGMALKICPLMNVNNEGKLTPRYKIRTKKKTMEAMLQQMEEHAENGTGYTGKVFMCHSDCYEDARAVADMIEERFPHINGKVMINNIGTVIGAHTGPGTVALFFYGDERTE